MDWQQYWPNQLLNAQHCQLIVAHFRTPGLLLNHSYSSLSTPEVSWTSLTFLLTCRTRVQRGSVVISMEFRDPINAEHLLSQPFFLVNLQFYQSDRVQTSSAKVKFQLQFLSWPSSFFHSRGLSEINVNRSLVAWTNTNRILHIATSSSENPNFILPHWGRSDPLSYWRNLEPWV